MAELRADDSLATLVADLDDSFWNAVPTPDSTPAKSRKALPFSTPHKQRVSPLLRKVITPSATKLYSAGDDFDVSQMLQGIEDWDWDCTLSEPGSPKKLPQILSVRVKSEEDHRTVTLQDDWTHTNVQIGDTINVIGTFTRCDTPTSRLSITICSKYNFLILHPDLLITATALSTANQCRRKPLLSGLVRSSTDYTPALVWGNLLHEVMQTCLTENKWDSLSIDQQIEQVISKSLMDLVRIDTTINDARRELRERSRGLLPFASKYLSETPKPEAVLINTRDTSKDAPSLLAISNVLDIEEDIWSPTYGLKGKLDVTVYAHTASSTPQPTSTPFNQARVTNNTSKPNLFISATPTSSPPSIIDSSPIPFEIKTGRAHASADHRAQTMLYTLLAEERYGSAIPAGLLYYTQSEEVVRVPRSRNEIRALIGTRNELASWMMKRVQNQDYIIVEESFLPPTIDDERICKRCYVVDTCMLYRKAVENVIDKTSPIADMYQLKTSHLTPSHCQFFKKWEALLSYEERDLIRFKKELWTMKAEEREKKGRCFAGMVIDESYDRAQLDSTQKCAALAGMNFDMDESISTVVAGSSKIHRHIYSFSRCHEYKSPQIFSERSLLSSHINVGDAITISVEPHLLALARGFVLELTATNIIVGVDHDVSPASIKAKLVQAGLDGSRTVMYRLDRDELFGGMGRMRNNLAHLFYAEVDEGKNQRLRELVVDLERPVVCGVPSPVSMWGLNPTQMYALERVLSARDYALILGMPGTGKTTVIASLICTLVQLGKTVLFTSYTHSAVDTILLKLDGMSKASRMCDYGVLRLGNVDKVHPQVRKYTLAARSAAQSIEQLESQLMTPPVVRNTVAREGGLDVSLFRRLSDAHPESVVKLAHQYRMNEDIMLLSNKLVYGDRLKCGNEQVAQQSLNIPDRSFVDCLHVGGKKPECCGHNGHTEVQVEECWLERLMAGSTKAVFVDTDMVPAKDSRVGDLVQNTVEAGLVYQTVESLLRSGVIEEQIGVISLYRQQIKLISQLLVNRTGIEILTADKSQGRDKDCIVISMVRSNDLGLTGDLVKDWRRMNVSFTRARRKLVIFGSRSTLQGVPLLDDFFQLMDEKGWMLTLPRGADVIHRAAFGPPEPQFDAKSRNCNPAKRAACDGLLFGDKENISLWKLEDEDRPRKKAKVVKGTMGMSTATGILKGRPILQDLVNEEL
ncbi:hypothetical protein AMATHDRAFT_142035 [Amanita thiersii Skay4041]|uniref:DNA replication ATP-dependent helicase/nuclease DNA2 n=1 Tax=Amanita thiersii Skay4041 TaxID=703135 RepID=A0A2A9NVB4_9AGAR|nr:hypothetical protein AMATHDRAFT_142035 [Amanita thiersii Skay4041]